MADQKISVTRSQVMNLSHLKDVTVDLTDCIGISVILRNCTDVTVSIDDDKGTIIEDKKYVDTPVYREVTLK